MWLRHVHMAMTILIFFGARAIRIGDFVDIHVWGNKTRRKKEIKSTLVPNRTAVMLKVFSSLYFTASTRSLDHPLRGEMDKSQFCGPTFMRFFYELSEALNQRNL